MPSKPGSSRRQSQEETSRPAVDDYSSRYLSYTCASLADSLRQAPDLTVESASISLAEYTSGKLGPTTLKTLFKLHKQKSRPDIDEDRLWPIGVTLCPWVYHLKPDHAHESYALSKLIAPVVMWAKVARNGALSPYEAPGLRTRPYIPRDLLDPSEKHVTLGELQQADQVYATLDDVNGEWSKLVAQADELIVKVTGRSPGDLGLNTHVLGDEGCCLPTVPRASTLHIQRLTDIIAEAKDLSLPLYDALWTTSTDRPIKRGLELLDLSALHVGQMESRYALSASQRETLLHQLDLAQEPTSVLAVDGPPGTGKTTLLLSVIATSWVRRAVEGGEPPLIVASSTNGKAVENILEAFWKVVEKDNALAGRWLPDIKSYGQYLCSQGREEALEDAKFPIHTFMDVGDKAQFSARALEDRQGWERAREMFLTYFRQAFAEVPEPTVERAAATLQQHLQATVSLVARAAQSLKVLDEYIPLDTMTKDALDSELARLSGLQADAQQSTTVATARVELGLLWRHQWKRHVADESWWRGLLCAIGIEFPRRTRDASFCSELELAHRSHVDSSLREVSGRAEIDAWVNGQLVRSEAHHREAMDQQQRAEQTLRRFDAAFQEIKQWLSDGDQPVWVRVQEALDLGPRFDAFKLATHYWEARYLLEVEERLKRVPPARDPKSVPGLTSQYLRLAKLFPCSVCTLFMLPKFYVGWAGADQPMYGAIDLLIVDEAGQVSPEIGTPAFTLAKRALVVGDVDQLAPIWNVGPAIDRRNASQCGLIDELDEYDAFQDSGRAAYQGKLMIVAQRASPFTKNASRGRGMFLSEHRRCWREIISICNSLVYGDLLVPARKEEPRRLLPSVGYVHIAAVDRLEGTSRKNAVEAAAIAKWLARRKEEIERAFADDEKPFGDLVAIVTPFKAQAREIRRALRHEFGNTQGITVGTIHALQGAECRVVIFSATYGQGTRPGSTFFDQDPSMLNVAVSRARDAFLVFGNMDLFRPIGKHPAAIVGRHLFHTGDNELTDVPVELIVPTINLEHTELIHELEAHREVLRRAFAEARFRLVIVSPYISSWALEADRILEQVRAARKLRPDGSTLRIDVVSDRTLNEGRAADYKECLSLLRQAGAQVFSELRSGVHSKLLLVDSTWLVVGSFNWLSAVRDPSHRYARHDSSMRYDGPRAVELITTSLHDLKELISRP